MRTPIQATFPRGLGGGDHDAFTFTLELQIQYSRLKKVPTVVMVTVTASEAFSVIRGSSSFREETKFM